MAEIRGRLKRRGRRHRPEGFADDKVFRFAGQRDGLAEQGRACGAERSRPVIFPFHIGADKLDRLGERLVARRRGNNADAGVPRGRAEEIAKDRQFSIGARHSAQEEIGEIGIKAALLMEQAIFGEVRLVGIRSQRPESRKHLCSEMRRNELRQRRFPEQAVLFARMSSRERVDVFGNEPGNVLAAVVGDQNAEERHPASVSIKVPW
ncbi:MAG: hypothetical protein E5X15_03805 [Mesorhizobium sp.]|nr:MAG: hypothetical protein E5X15_03805 [Mesorhizobium sp.]